MMINRNLLNYFLHKKIIGSGGLYYYNYAAEDTTAATAEEPEAETDPTFLGLTITPFVRILILVVLASITLPHQMEITSVKRRRRGNRIY